MAAEPTAAPITFLDSRDEALTELALALDTERSANKAMIEAVKGLDRMLGEQREVNADLAQRTIDLEAQLVEYSASVSQQKSENTRLWCDLTVAEHRLADELAKPLWRRMLKR